MRFDSLLHTIALGCCLLTGCTNQGSNKTSSQKLVATDNPPQVADVLEAGDLPVASMPAGNQQSTSVEWSIPELIELVEPAVVRLDVNRNSGDAIGSGFVVSQDGTIVTNSHVIKDAVSAKANFRDGKTVDVEGVLAVDTEKDIAVVKIRTSSTLSVIPIAESSPKKGERVVAFGAPQGLSFSATDGIISGIRTTTESKDLGMASGTWIQTTAPISGGNSGGPLVNLKGEVVGMNTLTFTKAQNTNFAISAVDIREVIADLGDKTLQTFAQITGKHERSLSRTAHENTDSAHRTKLLAALRTEVETRLKSIKDLESEIDYDLNQLKTAILSLDTRNETAFRNLVREKADKINSLVQLPLQSIVPLDPSKTRTGEIGVFTRPIEISQVVSKEEGRALCYSSHTQRASLTARSGPFFISNVDLTNFVDGNWFAPSSDLIFQTVGTRTYTTVAGSPKTVFEFSCIVNLRNEAVLEPLRSYKLTKSLEPIISGDEKRLIETRKREFADIQAQERANLAAKQKQEKRQAESKAKLSGAKQFLNQGKTDLAKKWLQKIVDDFADLPEAKEAQELLNKL